MNIETFNYRKNNSEFFELCKKLSISSDNERSAIISKIDNYIFEYLNNTKSYDYGELIYIINSYLQVNSKLISDVLRIEKIPIFNKIIALYADKKNIDESTQKILLDNIKKYIIPEIKNISTHIVNVLEKGEIKLDLSNFNYIYKFISFYNDICINYKSEVKDYIEEFSKFFNYTKSQQLITLAINNLNHSELKHFFNMITNEGFIKLILEKDFNLLLKYEKSQSFILNYLELIKVLLDNKVDIDIVNNTLIKKIIKYNKTAEEKHINFNIIECKTLEYNIMCEFQTQFLFEIYNNAPNNNIDLLIYYIETFLYYRFKQKNKTAFVNDPILKIILSIVRNEKYSDELKRNVLIKSLNKYNMLEYINNLPCATEEDINYYIKHGKIKKLISESEKYYDAGRIIPYNMAQCLLEYQIMHLCNKKMSSNAFKSVIISLSKKLLEENVIYNYSCQFCPNEIMKGTKGTQFRCGFIRYNINSLDDFLNNGISDYKNNIFNVMYHEIRHAIQYQKINGTNKYYDTLLMYKEDAINFLYDGFYKNNYKQMKVEVDARNYSVRKFLEIMFEIRPNISEQYLPFALEYLKKYTNKDIAYKKHFKDKQEIKEVSAMFDEVIKQYPILLNDNPVLKIQYNDDCTRRSNSEVIKIIDNIIRKGKESVEYRNLAYGILNYEKMNKNIEEMIVEIIDFSLLEIYDDKLARMVDLYLKEILNYLKKFARSLVVSGKINELTDYDIKLLYKIKELSGIIDNEYFRKLISSFVNIIESNFNNVNYQTNNKQK